MHITVAAQGGLEMTPFIRLYQSRCHFQTTILENIQNYWKVNAWVSSLDFILHVSQISDFFPAIYAMFEFYSSIVH